tara:strand:+ start:375 stop:674 length:300 start_codon:yes stop_codon:yes gene_type:complete
MKIYTKIILDKNNKLIKEEFFYYEGPISYAGIHYDFKSTRGAKAMEKQAKREKKLAERRAKKQAKAQEKGLVEKVNKEDQSLPLDTVITLDHLTNPDKK